MEQSLEKNVKTTYVSCVENCPVSLDQQTMVYHIEAKVFDSTEQQVTEQLASNSLMNAHRDSGLPQSPSVEFPPEIPAEVPAKLHTDDVLKEVRSISLPC